MKLKWYEIFILFLLIPMAVYGDVTVEKELGKDVYKDSKGKKYQTTEVSLIPDFSYKKPDIIETKLLTEDEKDVVEFSLKQNGRRLVHNKLRHAKNDYKHDFDRGTAEYTPTCRNYSYHKVIIPDGITVSNSNFTQRKPHTKAIEGKNLVFIDCNLANNLLDDTWTVDGKSAAGKETTQIDFSVKSQVDNDDGTTTLFISQKVKKAGVFVEEHVEEEIVDNSLLINVLRRFE